MLHIIKSITDPLISLIKDDPVRPEISAEERVAPNREILTLLDEEQNPIAVVCVAFCDYVPTSVEELLTESINPSAAIFYTIWSYGGGAGRDLIFEAKDYIKQTYQNVTRFVTLSPPTEMARRFHHKNGAVTFRENETTVNYEYEEKPPIV
jgi:hypothetical protein